ncbi:MAG: trypsin, partial [Dehalococcoidia bacterium]
DGYVGNDMAIIDAVRKNADTTRVFSFGIGNSVNRSLLDGMARAGRGEAVGVGPREAVDRLIDWCRQGPALAFVTGVEVSPEEPQGRRGFDVIH